MEPDCIQLRLGVEYSKLFVLFALSSLTKVSAAFFAGSLVFFVGCVRPRDFGAYNYKYISVAAALAVQCGSVAGSHHTSCAGTPKT